MSERPGGQQIPPRTRFTTPQEKPPFESTDAGLTEAGLDERQAARSAANTKSSCSPVTAASHQRADVSLRSAAVAQRSLAHGRVAQREQEKI
jgi:hypothetical protein